MAQVKRLVGIRRRELNHHVLSGSRKLAELLSSTNLCKSGFPELLRKFDIKETLNHIVVLNIFLISLDILTNLCTGSLRRLSAHLQKRESHKSNVTLKLLSGSLSLDHLVISLNAIQSLNGLLCYIAYKNLWIHLFKNQISF